MTDVITKPHSQVQGWRANQLGNRAQLPFHFSAYWGTWSRVLLLQHKGGSTVELNLTPINPMYERNWAEQVRPAMFRIHSTQLDKKDKELLELPAGVRDTMNEWLGADVAGKLIDWDWLTLIDPVKLRNVLSTSGGTPINLVLKDGIRWAH